MTRWRWRGSVALLAVAIGFVMYPVIESESDVISSDWPAFATGARILLSDPGHLYNFELQRRVELNVTGGRTLTTIANGFLPFVGPAWTAFFAIPFGLLGPNLGGRIWQLFGLACLALGLYLAVRPRAAATILPAFASVPSALMLVNAQFDGVVALGIGSAIWLWSRPYVAGLCLGLTLLKPQLALPLAAALVVAGRWRVLGGWATAGVAFWGAAALLDPLWVLKWLPAINGPVGQGGISRPVGPGSREIDLPHLGTLFPDGSQALAIATLTIVSVAAVVLLARLRRNEFRSAAAILLAGGVLAAPHAHPTDLVLVALALVIWGETEWYDWLVLSVGALFAAVAPVPIPAVVGVLTIGWILLRAAGTIPSWQRGPEPLSTG
ncbi:MAG: hypothetical protein PVS3B2_04960 [Candidatus Dormibacteraceae bacterium]